MHSIIELCGCFRICNSNHSALVRVKRHQPFTLPGFESSEVGLQGLAVCLVGNSKVHYSVVSEEPDVALYHVRHVIKVEKEQTRSKNGSLWYTRHDRARVRLLAIEHYPLGPV